MVWDYFFHVVINYKVEWMLYVNTKQSLNNLVSDVHTLEHQIKIGNFPNDLTLLMSTDKNNSGPYPANIFAIVGSH